MENRKVVGLTFLRISLSLSKRIQSAKYLTKLPMIHDSVYFRSRVVDSFDLFFVNEVMLRTKL